MNWPDPTRRPSELFWRGAARNPYLNPVFGAPSYKHWRWMLRAFDGDCSKLSPEGKRFVRDRLGGSLPGKEPNEIYIVGGRQGGKTNVVGGVMVPALVLFPGVKPPCTVALAARSIDQTDRLFIDVTRSLLRIPGLVSKPGARAIECSNGVKVERLSANFKSVRSRVLAAVVLDELGFWESEDEEAAYSDEEFINAVRPALRVRDQGGEPGILIGLSSPWKKSGALYKAYNEHFGKPGRTIVMQGSTVDMRPTVDRAFLAAERAKDKVNYSVEYEANFRLAQYGFLTEAEVAACVDDGVKERPPDRSCAYEMFVDHSSGHGRDPAAAAVGHWAGNHWVIDAIRRKAPPFKRPAAIGLFAELARRYGVRSVVGDQWDGVTMANHWQEAGFVYKPAEFNKSKLYQAAMPMIVEGSVRLLDDPRLKSELVELERRTTRTSEIIDHPPGKHDDVANVVCGLIAGKRAGAILTRKIKTWR